MRIVAFRWVLTVVLFTWLHNGNSLLSEEIENESENLYKEWSEFYELDKDHPPFLDLTSHTPIAPHLQDCIRLNWRQKNQERYQKDGRPPIWAIPDPVTNQYSPPWIRGGTNENLAHTHYFQTLLWRNQFPQNCSSNRVKFAIVSWPRLRAHGLGSSLHVFSNALAVAFQKGRVLVPSPGTFERANNEVHCRGPNIQSLSCYFSPPTSRKCERRALRLWAQIREKSEENFDPMDQSLPVIQMPVYQKRIIPTRGLERPWRDSPQTIEILGEILKIVPNMTFDFFRRPTRDTDEDRLAVGWWYSQAIRFLLRYPSNFLCHQINKHRHQSYGKFVARNYIKSIIEQENYLIEMKEKSPKDYAILKNVKFENPQNLESKIWRYDEPYIPRPIVSVHIRQGDKSKEMKLFQLSSFIWGAQRLRRFVPHLKRIWLSTEMQEVIDATVNHKSWDFLYTNNPRQSGALPMISYEEDYGLHNVTVLSFVNLIISSQCDFFVGVLGSNWNRLINELRLTNGRLNSGMVALNYDEV